MLSNDLVTSDMNDVENTCQQHEALRSELRTPPSLQSGFEHVLQAWNSVCLFLFEAYFPTQLENTGAVMIGAIQDQSIV